MATVPAVLGTARLGNFRLGYRPAALTAARQTHARILINGVNVRPTTIMSSVTVHDVINDAPNTASLTVHTTAPTVQQSCRISVNSDAPVLLFDGTLQTVDSTYVAKPIAGRTLQFPCTAIDDGARAKRRRPFGTWTNVSATTIAQSLVSTFMPGFTSKHVQAGLPAISLNLDGSEGIDGAFTAIAKLIGGYWYVEDLDTYLFTDASIIGLPLPLDIDNTPGRFLNDPPIKVTVDDSQLVTRYYGKGHAEAILADVLANETILPVSNAAAWFGTVTPGGKAISDTQRLAYTGVVAGDAGGFVGPGVTPGAAPTGNAQGGSGIDPGVHKYGFVWKTAGGPTLPSPLLTITHATIAAPSAAPYRGTDHPTWSANAWTIGDTYEWAYAYGATANGDLTAETALSPISAAWVSTVGPAGAPWSAVPLVNVADSTDPAVKYIHFFERHNGGAWYQAMAWLNRTTGGATENTGYSSWGSGGPSNPTPNPQAQQSALASIGVGPAGTTARDVYRTVAGGSQLKFVATIADNTTTTYTDTMADAALGANAPVADTSGLTQPAGQVNAGATSLVFAGALPASGWIVLAPGTQVVRYTGITGNALTGIPASGPGAITAPVAYNSTITTAPTLTGVTGVVVPILKGAPINIWVQRDDVAAQALAAARDNDGGDGVYEAPPIVDERRGEASLNALCDANLVKFAYPLVTVVHGTRDVNAKSGKPQVFNLTNPAIHTTLTIQDVAWSEIDIVNGLSPKGIVTSSSVRFSLESLLQKMMANL